MQTTDMDKNYDALGAAALDIVAERVQELRGWEQSRAIRGALEELMDPELLGRVVEALAESAWDGLAREALESSTLSKQAGVVMGEMFGNVPTYPSELKRAGVVVGWTTLTDIRELGSSGKIAIRSGTVVSQKSVAKNEWRMLAELRGWIVGGRVERAPNGYVSVQLCAYGCDEAARARAKIWFDEAVPMSTWSAEKFLEPAAAQEAAVEARALSAAVPEAKKGLLARLRAL